MKTPGFYFPLVLWKNPELWKLWQFSNVFLFLSIDPSFSFSWIYFFSVVHMHNFSHVTFVVFIVHGAVLVNIFFPNPTPCAI